MINFSKDQNNFFNWVENDNGNVILEAVAGSGKTFTILKSIENITSSVCLLAFNKKMAEEFKEKIITNEKLKNHPHLVPSTFHSIGFSALKNCYSFYIKLDDNKVKKITKEFAAENNDFKEYIPGVISLVSMAKNRAIGIESSFDDFEAWRDIIDTFQIDFPFDFSYEKAIKFAKIVLNKSNNTTKIIDFDDMIYLPLKRQIEMKQYDWVFIDEAQDTNPSRRLLAKKLLKDNGRFVAVGDRHQSIFGFTGTDNDSLDKIANEFNTTYLPLTTSFRCPRSVIKHAKGWVKHIEPHTQALTGFVETIDYDNLYNSFLNKEYKDISILCRYNSHLVSLCFNLIKNGYPAKIEGRNIGENIKKLALRWKQINTLNQLENKLNDYLIKETNKALLNEQETRAEQIKDQVETLFVIIERARLKNITYISDLTLMIEEIFDDNISNKNLITLSTVHKSKGMEWKYVYILGREQFMPSKYAKYQWQKDQEKNLIYVSITRAMIGLYEITNVPE